MDLDFSEIRQTANSCNSGQCNKCQLRGGGLCNLRNNWLLEMADEIERLRGESVWSRCVPEACKASVAYYKGAINGKNYVECTTFARPIPKTREREIAEKWKQKLNDNDNLDTVDAIEQAILESKEASK